MIGGDVVEERRHHEHAGEQHEAAFPVIRQQVRQHLGHAALLEVIGPQREAQQQPEQVRERAPLVAEVRVKAGQAGTGLEAGDDDRAGERDLQRVVVEQRDAEKRQRKQHEVERDAGQRHRRGVTRRGNA